jgi:phosphoribosylformylglycinamidine synthase
MCLAAEHGLELSLDAVPGASDLSPVQMLFSESASRLILATPARSAGRLEELLVAEGVPWGCLGEVVPAPLLRVTSGRAPVLEVSIADLRRTWERRDREVHDA